jgi:hypothetical protein
MTHVIEDAIADIIQPAINIINANDNIACRPYDTVSETRANTGIAATVAMKFNETTHPTCYDIEKRAHEHLNRELWRMSSC